MKIWTGERKRFDEPGAPVKEKLKYISAFKVMYLYAKPHQATFLLAIVCTLLAIGADLLQPYLVKVAIDEHLLNGERDFGTILIIALTYLLLSAGGLVFTYWQNNLLQFAGLRIVARIRKELFKHITRLSMSYFDRVGSGSLITNVSSDTETLNQFFSQVLLTLIRDGMTLVFILVMMFQLDRTLAYYCLVVLPVIGLIAVSFRSYMRRTYQLSRARLSRLISFAAENLSGINLIQAFHQEAEQGRRFADHNAGVLQANLREVRTNVWFNRTFDILGHLSVALVTWLGGMAVLDMRIEYGVLYAFITYTRQFFQPINHITQQWNTLQSSTVSVNRIWSVFATKPDIEDDPAPVLLDPNSVAGRIDFNKIGFSYTEGLPVIHELDLHIRPGETIGIAGSTGAGKSSLVSLLCRFYDVDSGSIELDGTDIRRIPQNRLHRIIGLIQQEPYFYSGTVIDNVRLFDSGVSRERVMEACRLVGAEPLIERLSEGYDTLLSERGTGLSAGERQLISFARIVVQEPKVLILDEATANLDSYSEMLIQKALQVVSKGRTTLVIAHRLSTIRNADRIIVLRNGRIAEEGSHKQLLELHGEYEKMVMSIWERGILEVG